MTRVSLLRVLNIPHGGSGGGGLTWLFRATFGGGDQAAPLPSPLGAPAVEIGSLTITDTGNNVSISGGVLTWTNIVGLANPQIKTDTWARVPGLMIRHRSTLASRSVIGLYEPSDTVISGFDTTGGLAATVNINININNDQDIAWVLWDVGLAIFSMNTPTAPRLAWVELSGSQANVLLRCWSVNSAGVRTLGPVSARVITGDLTTRAGIASQNVASPVSGTSYTATADAITDLTLTAPNPLADSAGYRYRYTDDDNCWHSYFNSAGAYRLDSVAASVATNRINVAAVIAAAGTATMRTISNGSLHNAFTLAATTWTKRGAQINVSHLNTNTAIRPYVTGSWAMSNLRSYPTTDPRYDAELNKT